MLYREFYAYVAACIRDVTPIDREMLTAQTDMSGAELETAIVDAVSAFCLESRGSTGTFDCRRGERKPFRKREKRECQTVKS